MGHVIFLDTETGGLDPARHALLTVALVEWRDGETRDPVEFKVRSDGLTVDPRALEVNRIDLARHDDAAWSRQRAREEIRLWMELHRPPSASRLPSRVVVGGHNVTFDLGFLDALFEGNFTRRTWGTPVDTMTLYGFFQEAGRTPFGSRSLDAAMAAFGVAVPEERRHTALGDVLGTVELYAAMLRSLRQ